MKLGITYNMLIGYDFNIVIAVNRRVKALAHSGLRTYSLVLLSIPFAFNGRYRLVRQLSSSR